jgi:hypothetical protein
MTRLILTTDDSGAGSLKGTGIADIVIPFGFRFVWGPLPSDAEFATLLEARSTKHDSPGSHWLDFVRSRHLEEIEGKGLGLVELCERCETIQLWIDPDPNSQLTLVWPLDYLRHHAKIASKLTLVQSDVAIGGHQPEQVATWRLPAVKIPNDHLEAASMAWQAYREPTPQDWFNLLGKDLSVLPQLRQTVLELLEELPMRATGLGATEMRMLELISAGNACPFDVFPGHRKPNKPFVEEMHDDRVRHERYKQSRLSLTALGEAILAGTEDFSRHNPIHRWWGGTELTNDRLWCWDPANRALIAP